MPDRVLPSYRPTELSTKRAGGRVMSFLNPIPCHRDFTHASSGAFSGYRWPPDVIITAVRWYLSYPLSARQVTELLAERGIDVSARTVLTWTQTFGPQLATAARRHRRRLGRRWYVDEVFLFHGAAKRYLYRAVDEHGQVVDVLLRERRDLASAQAFFRRARATAETEPAAIVTDHHQPYVRAAQQNLPGSQHIRTGLHRLSRRDHQTDRAQPHRDPRSTASLPGSQDHGDRSAIPRRVRGDACSATRGCRSAVAGAWLPSPVGHSRRPYAGRRRCHGHPGFRADKGRLTVTPRRSSRFNLPQPQVAPHNFADSSRPCPNRSGGR